MAGTAFWSAGFCSAGFCSVATALLSGVGWAAGCVAIALFCEFCAVASVLVVVLLWVVLLCAAVSGVGVATAGFELADWLAAVAD